MALGRGFARYLDAITSLRQVGPNRVSIVAAGHYGNNACEWTLEIDTRAWIVTKARMRAGGADRLQTTAQLGVDPQTPFAARGSLVVGRGTATVDASLVSFEPAFSDAAARDVERKMADPDYRRDMR